MLFNTSILFSILPLLSLVTATPTPLKQATRSSIIQQKNPLRKRSSPSAVPIPDTVSRYTFNLEKDGYRGFNVAEGFLPQASGRIDLDAGDYTFTDALNYCGLVSAMNSAQSFNLFYHPDNDQYTCYEYTANWSGSDVLVAADGSVSGSYFYNSQT